MTPFAPSVIPTGLVNPAEYGRKWIPPEQELTGDRGRKSAKPFPETRPWEDIVKSPRTMFADAARALFPQFFVKRFATPRQRSREIPRQFNIAVWRKGLEEQRKNEYEPFYAEIKNEIVPRTRVFQVEMNFFQTTCSYICTRK